jgi:hypothetical protein
MDAGLPPPVEPDGKDSAQSMPRTRNTEALFSATHSRDINNAYAKTAIKPDHNDIMKITTISLLTLGAALCGCGTAQVSGRREIVAAPTDKPVTIYVSDFDLDASHIKSEPGLLPAPPKLSGPLGQIVPPPPGAPKDPQALARDLVDSMSASLVNDLTKAGRNARRLAPGAPLPASGWLVRGVFTDVNQGNQLRRAVIGFGMGRTDLQVVVDINDLAQGAPKRFYELNTTADSGKAPGAGPTIVLGPAGVAARFVIAGKDLDRNVKQTASKIAAEVVQRARPTS